MQRPWRSLVKSVRYLLYRRLVLRWYMGRVDVTDLVIILRVSSCRNQVFLTDSSQLMSSFSVVLEDGGQIQRSKCEFLSCGAGRCPKLPPDLSLYVELLHQDPWQSLCCGWLETHITQVLSIYVCFVSVKGKAIPLQAWTGPEGSRRLRLPDFKTIGT